VRPVVKKGSGIVISPRSPLRRDGEPNNNSRGGSDPFGVAGGAGDIVIQPGTSGGGSGGSGGSTIVRAPANITADIFAMQSDTGAVTHWAVASDGRWNGIKPIHTTETSGLNRYTLLVNGAGTKNGGDFTAVNVGSTATSAAGGRNTGLAASAIGDWTGPGAVNRALVCRAVNGAKNYAAIFEAGNVGINELAPTARLHVGAGTASLAPLKLTAGTNLSTPEAGAIEFDGTQLFVTEILRRTTVELLREWWLMTKYVCDCINASMAMLRIFALLPGRIHMRLLLALLCGLGPTFIRAEALFTPLGFFGGVESKATDVSADGSVVVGVSSAFPIPGGALNVFRWTSDESAVRATSLLDGVVPVFRATARSW
jgi:hypothetical protein